jgi:hypothetical protein
MPTHRGTVWSTLLLTVLLVACGDAPYEPTPAHLVGEFSGQAGESLQTYDLFLAMDEVNDSVRGQWSLAFQTACPTHDGPFSGTLDGDQLRLRLRPDEDHEATFDLTLRVVPGDSVLNGRVTLVELGSVPGGGQTLCFNDFAPITLHYGEVDGLPRGGAGARHAARSVPAWATQPL